MTCPSRSIDSDRVLVSRANRVLLDYFLLRSVPFDVRDCGTSQLYVHRDVNTGQVRCTASTSPPPSTVPTTIKVCRFKSPPTALQGAQRSQPGESEQGVAHAHGFGASLLCGTRKLNTENNRPRKRRLKRSEV